MSAVKKVEEFEAVGFVPVKRPDIPPYPMFKPFDWLADPYNDPNWCFQLQTLRYLMIYQSAYRETGNEDYLLSLIDWFGDWWSSAKSSPGSYTWHDMATGIRSEKIHQLAQEIKASEIKKPVWFDEMIQAHVRVLRKKGFIRLNHNHGLYAVHGLRCLAEHLGPGMKKNVLSYAYSCFEKIIKNQFDENYVHKEHSPHYHHLVLRSLKDYRKMGLYDSLNVLDEYIEGAEKVAPNLYLPDGREIPFGDTDNNELIVSENTPLCEIESLWCASGYAVYKKEQSYLCMTNSFNSQVHKHWDNLSFIYGEKGRDILVDPGKYKYSSDSIRQSVLSSCCHNTVTLEKHGWSGRCLQKNSLFIEAERCLSGVVFNAGMVLDLKKTSIRISRRLCYSHDGLEVIDKAVFDGASEKLVSTFVFHKDIEIIEKNETGFIISSGGLVAGIFFDSDAASGKNEPAYQIKKIPVSYAYGSYVDSFSAKVFFHSLLVTRVRLC